MARERIFDEPMTDAQRRARSRAEKIKRGEMRVDTFLSPEASQALQQITGGSAEKGAVKAALEAALLAYVQE